MGKVHTSGDCVRGPPFLAHLLFGGAGQNAGDFFVRVVAHLIFRALAHLTE